jgi:hypothetical protein
MPLDDLDSHARFKTSDKTFHAEHYVSMCHVKQEFKVTRNTSYLPDKFTQLCGGQHNSRHYENGPHPSRYNSPVEEISRRNNNEEHKLQIADSVSHHYMAHRADMRKYIIGDSPHCTDLPFDSDYPVNVDDLPDKMLDH